MNQIIYFCATYLIFIAALYAMYRVLTKHEEKHRLRHIIIVAASAPLAWAASHFLKGIIAHPRPDLTLALLQPKDLYSFPSGHASFMFALAFAVQIFDKRSAKILFVLAVVTGIARVLAGVHFWYDIVGGFILAWAVTCIVSYIAKRTIRKA